MPSFTDPNCKSHPFRLKLDTNILHAQAFGCWLYVQIGSWGLFCGSHCKRGLRIVWRTWRPRVRWERFQ
jgi:hypothetical protein